MSGDSEIWSSNNFGCRLTEPETEVITCELLPDQEIPLLKRRQELKGAVVRPTRCALLIGPLPAGLGAEPQRWPPSLPASGPDRCGC